MRLLLQLLERKIAILCPGPEFVILVSTPYFVSEGKTYSNRENCLLNIPSLHIIGNWDYLYDQATFIAS